MVTPLRIVFLGTPAFAVPSLRALLCSPHAVVAVVTQPDRPRGRGHKVRPEAVKLAALEAGLPVLQPERLNEPGFRDTLGGLAPDLGVVAAYGKLLPEALLALPRLGMINVHASMLPRWRGAAPVHRAILAGDEVSGVTIMRVVKALDAGPMLAATPTPIGPDETSAELERRLAELGAQLLVEAVDSVAAGTAVEIPQDESAVTYAPRLSRAESQIDWARPAAAVHNQIRGLHPWPLAAAMFRGQRTRLLRSAVATQADVDATPGTVYAVQPDAIEVATRPGAVRVTQLQIAGKAAMSAAEFLRGHPVQPGDRFLPLPPAV
jgi:methionyl-tRNA formyltransferase